MKIVFRERKRKKTKHESLNRILLKSLNKYINPSILDDLKIEVNLKPFYEDEKGELYQWGCLPYRRFTIVLDNDAKIWKIKQALRHELIHLKQIVNQELIEYDVKRFIWKNKMVDPETKYWDLPWEIEAYELENIR